MPRSHRPNSPGVPFHLTARIQGKAALFSGLESTVVALIRTCAERSDGELLAYAVMPNHLHLIYVQGPRRLAYFAQPLLTRLALLLRRTWKQEGHIFERRFYAKPCTNADYLRNMIAYVHLNGVRRGLCDVPDTYPWTGHAELCAGSDATAFGRFAAWRTRALQMFARSSESPLSECVLTYRSFLHWRQQMDAHRDSAAAQRGEPGPQPPITWGGDSHWNRVFAPACEPLNPMGGAPRPRPDLRDFMKYALEELEPGMPFDVLRGGGRGKALVRIRTTLIVRASERGYTGHSIARFLHVSPTTVSRHLASYRS